MDVTEGICGRREGIRAREGSISLAGTIIKEGSYSSTHHPVGSTGIPAARISRTMHRKSRL